MDNRIKGNGFSPRNMTDDRFGYQMQLDITKQQIELYLQAIKVLNERKELAKELRQIKRC